MPAARQLSPRRQYGKWRTSGKLIDLDPITCFLYLVYLQVESRCLVGKLLANANSFL